MYRSLLFFQWLSVINNQLCLYVVLMHNFTRFRSTQCAWWGL